MEKNPPLSKIYEALSAVADQRIDIQADRAYVLSSDPVSYTHLIRTPPFTAIRWSTVWIPIF